MEEEAGEEEEAAAAAAGDTCREGEGREGRAAGEEARGGEPAGEKEAPWGEREGLGARPPAPSGSTGADRRDAPPKAPAADGRGGGGPAAGGGGPAAGGGAAAGGGDDDAGAGKGGEPGLSRGAPCMRPLSRSKRSPSSVLRRNKPVGMGSLVAINTGIKYCYCSLYIS